MIRFGTLLSLVGASLAAWAVRRHVQGSETPAGILVRNAAVYDAVTGFILGSFFKGVAADAATTLPDKGRVLEVGCGPGHLSIRLAQRHRLEVTGVDLDPAMIERAEGNAHSADPRHPRPSFQVGDVASLPYPDQSFHLVVSTLSMHHWSDPTAGLAEIHRVLHPEGKALIWDLRPGIGPFHRHRPDPVVHTHGSPLRVTSIKPWPWPWRLKLTQRIELVRRDERSPDADP